MEAKNEGLSTSMQNFQKWPVETSSVMKHCVRTKVTPAGAKQICKNQWIKKEICNAGKLSFYGYKSSLVEVSSPSVSVS